MAAIETFTQTSFSGSPAAAANGHDAFDALRESDHRIANHLTLLASMVQIQMGRLVKGPETLPRDEAHSVLRETVGRILSVSHLHRRLSRPAQKSEIDVGDYLLESTTDLVNSLSLQDKVRIAQRLATHCNVSAEDAQVLGLLVSEVIMNAVKHAHPTGIPVQITLVCDRNTQGNLVVEIGDDGVGLPENFDVGKAGGVGFRLIRSLADKLGATLTIESDSLGLTFRLLFPAVL
jgi:two-component sensor histidine kinase